MRIILKGRGVEVLAPKLRSEGNHVVVGVPNLSTKLGASTAVKLHNPDMVAGEIGESGLSRSFSDLNIDIWGTSPWGDRARIDADYWEQLLTLANTDTINFGEVQDSVDPRIDLECGAVWRGDSFHYHHIVLVERGFMDGGVGANSVAGCLLVPVSSRSLLMELSINRLKSLLKKGLYKGPVWMGDKPLIGFDLMRTASLLEVLKGNTDDALFGKVVDTRFETAVAVHISVPPFPTTPKPGSPEVEVPTTPEALKHMWLYNKPRDGNLGFLTARGKDIREAKRRVYRGVKRVRVDDLQYRGDIGELSSKVLQQLKNLKLLG